MSKIVRAIAVCLTVLALVVPVFGATYHYSDSYSYINYYDNDSTFTATSEASVRSGGPISACVGNGSGYWYCDNSPNSGSVSKRSYTFSTRNQYNAHNHAIYDHGNLRYTNIK